MKALIEVNRGVRNKFDYLKVVPIYLARTDVKGAQARYHLGGSLLLESVYCRPIP